MNERDVTIVIAQRGHEALTEACVESLRRCEPLRWPIVVVDDASPMPVRLDRLAQRDVDVVVHGAHRGVSAAWNSGARLARSEWVVFLNNDVVVRGAWVERLTGPLRRSRAAVTGVALRRETAVDEGLQRRSGFPRRFLEGWCLSMKVAFWRNVGGFDERFCVYFGDTDFQARARRYGELAAVENLSLLHLGHRTAHDRRCLADRRECWRRDRETFLRKWGDRGAGIRDRGSAANV